jgi:hypothetical protein
VAPFHFLHQRATTGNVDAPPCGGEADKLYRENINSKHRYHDDKATLGRPAKFRCHFPANTDLRHRIPLLPDRPNVNYLIDKQKIFATERAILGCRIGFFLAGREIGGR